jgi:NADP-dependent 3-hydroxy acid dehydrogenase YdfG
MKLIQNNIAGKVVLITGASSGIGEATARHLASLGAIVSLAARRPEKLAQVVADITAAGGRAQAFATDITQRAQVEALVKSTVDAFGRVDVLFNNAGVMLLSRLEQQQYAEWEQMLDTNVKGMLYGIGATLPYFQQQHSGHFINVSSISGHRVDPTSAVYSATKFAVRALSEGLRQEVKPYNVRTTILSPGVIQSELTQQITDPQAQEMVKGMAGLAISPNAIARAVAYALDQPQDVDVNEIILRPTAQPY